MAFKMKGFPTKDSVFKHKGCSKHKHPHFRNTVRTSGCSKKDKGKKVLGGIAKAGAVIGMLWGAKKKMDSM
jgi:hypothetical protein